MTPQEQETAFTNAFNDNRPTLALFAKCASKDELDVVRDAFFLGMASALCPPQYEAVRVSMITDPTSFASIVNTMNTPKALEAMITSARASEGWMTLLAALLKVANGVNSDLDEIWATLETGRLEWLGAVNSAHRLKIMLKVALKKDKNKTERDEMDSKMIYMYALSLSIPALEGASEAWRTAVKMEDKMNPLKGYDGDLWDPRKEEWRPLDLGVQAAAERGGSSFAAAWEA